MNPIIQYALDRNPRLRIHPIHGLWLMCDSEYERKGYTCIMFFDTHTLGL